jgi:hypothetical protein
VPAAVALGRRRATDLFEVRNAPDLHAWLESRPRGVERAISVNVADLMSRSGPRSAGSSPTPPRSRILSTSRVSALAPSAQSAAASGARRFGHQGRRPDPLHRARKLLTLAAGRLNRAGEARLWAAPRWRSCPAGPHTWAAKACLRDLYTLAGDPPLAAIWFDRLIDDLHDLDDLDVPELAGMARPLYRSRPLILAWHSTAPLTGLPKP